MNELEFTQFLTTYYLRPRPDRVPEALAWYAASSIGRDSACTGPMAYFFVRVAHMHPAMIERYRFLRGSVSTTGAILVDQVLSLHSRCPTVESLRSAMREITRYQAESVGTVLAATQIDTDFADSPTALTSLEMDCLWAEFCTTGDATVVLPIIAVLGWPDLIRHRLNDWLLSNSRISPAWLTRWRRNRVLRRLGLTYDAALERVGTLEDVDCFCAIQSMGVSSERFAKFRVLLPFELTEDEQTYIAVKAVAKWSLLSNAVQHPRILELCRRQLGVDNMRARISLAQVVRAADHARQGGDALEASLHA